MYYAAQYILLKGPQLGRGPQVADHYFRKPIWETSTTVTFSSSLDRFDNQINNDLPIIQDRNWWVIRERNLLAGDVSSHKK